MTVSEGDTLPGDEACLGIDELVAMVDGDLDPTRSDYVLSHIDQCAVCAEVVANLGSLDGPARRVGRYQIERMLGTGGMGVVYAAFDPELQRHVAIKLVRPDTSSPKLQAMILREARTLARVNHPNVVAVYDVGEHGGEVYVATEFVDGVTLADWTPRRDAAAIVGAWIQVARGLAAAHEEGVVHRDVKPANILVGRDGRVRIGDFGIAHHGMSPVPALGTDPAQALVTQSVAGTPAYMAPEQKRGLVDARSDQFATCVAIVETLTGRRPEADEIVALDPAPLAAALTRGLRAEPAERFPSMSNLAAALELAIAPPRRRAAMYAMAVAGVAVAIGAGLAVLTLRGSGAPGCRPREVPPAVWSAERRAALAKVLPVDMAPFVERWLASWSAVALDVCAAQSTPTVRTSRAKCLDDALSRLDEVLDRWEAAPPRRVLSLHEALEKVPHAAWCSQPAVIAAGEPAPEHVAEVDAIEAGLAAPQRDLEALRARARATRYVPTMRRVAVSLAPEREPPQAKALLREALATGPDDISKALATIALLPMMGADEVAEAEARADATRTSLAALGGDLALEAELDWALANVYQAADRNDDSTAALERSHQAFRAAYGAGSPQEANIMVSLAGAYYRREGTGSRRGRELAKAADEIWSRLAIEVPSALVPTTAPELIATMERLLIIARETDGSTSEAVFSAEFALALAYEISGHASNSLSHARAARDLGLQLGLRNERLVTMTRQVANTLLDLHRPTEALEPARTSIDMAQELGLTEHVALGQSVLGRALIETGDVAAARAPLEAALGYFRRGSVSLARCRVRYRLALALAAAAPRKALASARLARTELESFLQSAAVDSAVDPISAPWSKRIAEETLADVDGWLRRHGP